MIFPAQPRAGWFWLVHELGLFQTLKKRHKAQAFGSIVGETRPAPTEAPAEAPTAADAAPVRKRAKKTKTDPLALACQTGRHLKRASSNLLIMP